VTFRTQNLRAHHCRKNMELKRSHMVFVVLILRAKESQSVVSSFTNNARVNIYFVRR